MQAVKFNTTTNTSFFTQVLQQLPGIIAIMDEQSRIIYTNHYSANLLGFTNEEALLGLDARDMRCPVANNAEQYLEQDHFVRITQTPLTILDIQIYADGQQKILLTKKSPFVLPKTHAIGTICHCTELESKTMQNIASGLIQSDKSYFSKRMDRSYRLADRQSLLGLSERQLECLFYILRGKTAKEIGQLLKITSRTVETHLNSIKQKWGVSRKSDIIAYAIAQGLLNYIPYSITCENSSTILMTSVSV